MVDQERVCCMCGDVGFADKLFRCSHCRFRFQHLYCSNYYYGTSQEILSPTSSSSSSLSMTKSMEVCDWCQSEGRNNNNNNSSSSNKSFKRSTSSLSTSSSMDNRNNNNNHNFHHIRSEYTSSEQIKQHQQNNPTSSGERGIHRNNNSGVPSPRPSAHRRYKLLKDVMC